MSNRLKSMREHFHRLMGMFFAETTVQEEEATWQRFLVDKPPQMLGKCWRDQMVVWFHAQATQD